VNNDPFILTSPRIARHLLRLMEYLIKADQNTLYRHALQNVFGSDNFYVSINLDYPWYADWKKSMLIAKKWRTFVLSFNITEKKSMVSTTLFGTR